MQGSRAPKHSQPLRALSCLHGTTNELAGGQPQPSGAHQRPTSRLLLLVPMALILCQKRAESCLIAGLAADPWVVLFVKALPGPGASQGPRVEDQDPDRVQGVAGVCQAPARQQYTWGLSAPSCPCPQVILVTLVGAPAADRAYAQEKRRVPPARGPSVTTSA